MVPPGHEFHADDVPRACVSGSLSFLADACCLVMLYAYRDLPSDLERLGPAGEKHVLCWRKALSSQLK